MLAVNHLNCHYFPLQNGRSIAYQCIYHYFTVKLHIKILNYCPGSLQTIHSQICSFTAVSAKRLPAFPQLKVHSSFFTAHSSQQLLQNLQLNQTQPKGYYDYTSHIVMSIYRLQECFFYSQDIAPVIKKHSK